MEDLIIDIISAEVTIIDKINSFDFSNVLESSNNFNTVLEYLLTDDTFFNKLILDKLNQEMAKWGLKIVKIVDKSVYKDVMVKVIKPKLLVDNMSQIEELQKDADFSFSSF